MSWSALGKSNTNAQEEVELVNRLPVYNRVSKVIKQWSEGTILELWSWGRIVKNFIESLWLVISRSRMLPLMCVGDSIS